MLCKSSKATNPLEGEALSIWLDLTKDEGGDYCVANYRSWLPCHH